MQRMATVPTFAYSVATNLKSVFMASFSDGAMKQSSIHRVEFDQKDVVSPPVIANTNGLVRLIVADCDFVYMAITTGFQQGSIKYVNANAMQPEVPQVIVDEPKAGNVSAMAVDDRFLYYYAEESTLNRGVWAWQKSTKMAMKISSTSGPVSAIVSPGDGFVYWTERPMGSGRIMRARIPLIGELLQWQVATVRNQAGLPEGLAVDNMSVYWVNLTSTDSNGKLRKAPKDPAMSGQPDVPVAKIIADVPSEFPANWLAVDEKHIYFIHNRTFNMSGQIARSDKNIAGNIVIMADSSNSTTPFSAYSLAADPRRIYFSAPGGPNSDSHVMWVAK